MTISKAVRFIYLSPTEHDLKKVIPNGVYSSVCEANGCDILAYSNRGFLGFQRKSLADLEASLRDGRFHYQLAQIRSSQLVAFRFVILEIDRTRVTTDRRGFIDSSLTPDGLRTIAIKCFLNDTLLVESAGIGETVAIIDRTATYIDGDGGNRLIRPKPGTDAWGTRSSRDWSIHTLQSFPGVGPTTAAAIYDAYGLPLRWTITRDDLMKIDGVGKVTADRLLLALGDRD
jgi:ERCC4-type nuclease